MSIQNITKTMVNAVDLTSMSGYVFPETVQQNFLAPQSTYKLLDYLSSLSNNQNLIMCETRSGEYSVALAINPTNKVTTISLQSIILSYVVVSLILRHLPGVVLKVPTDCPMVALLIVVDLLPPPML